MTKNKFWEFKNITEQSAELLLYGDISDTTWWGDEITPKQFNDELNKIGAYTDITVRINSRGGDVFAAQAIGNMLEAHKGNVTARIDGVCASAATIIACHCRKVVAAEDSTYMIHKVKMGVFDYVDATQLQQYINAIETCKENILSVYVKKTGKEKEKLEELMDATSWWTGPEAKEQGFIDELTTDTEPVKVENRNGILFVNSVNMNMPFNKAPKFIQDKTEERRFENKPKPNKEEEKSMEINTVDELRSQYPDLVRQIEERATNAERERIRDIEEMCLAGNESFANEAKYEKQISAEEFAKQMIKNAKKQGGEYISNIKSDAENSGANAVGAAANQPQPGSVDEFMNAIRDVNKR